MIQSLLAQRAFRVRNSTVKLLGNGRFFGLWPFCTLECLSYSCSVCLIVDFRPLFELLSKIVRGQSPYTLKRNQYAMTSAIPVDKHGFDRQPFQFCKNKANVIKFLRTGYNPSCNLLIFFFVVLDQTDEQ